MTNASERLKAMAKQVPGPVWVTVVTIVLLALVAGLARAAAPSKHSLGGKSLTTAKELLESAKQLARQAAQDVEPRQRTRDVDTGLAYVAAARFLAPDAVLESKCGVKVDELAATLRALDK